MDSSVVCGIVAVSVVEEPIDVVVSLVEEMVVDGVVVVAGAFVVVVEGTSVVSLDSLEIGGWVV